MTLFQEVQEGTTLTLAVQLPEDTSNKEIILLKESQQMKPLGCTKIVRTSPTTTEIQIVKVKPKDEGRYSILIDNKEQPLMQLKVIPKPVTHQTIDIPQTTFTEGETLTFKCQLDTIPEETFKFIRNGKPLKSDDRISIFVDNKTYTIVVNDLKPDEDEGVYTLKSNHLTLDTPSIYVVQRETMKEPRETVNLVEEIKDEKLLVGPVEKPEAVDTEMNEKGKDLVSSCLKLL